MATRDIVAIYGDLDSGIPTDGIVLIEPNVRLVAPGVILPPWPVRAEMDRDTGVVTFPGMLTTDTPGVSPEGWLYKVTERIEASRPDPYYIELPTDDEPLDLSDVTPVDPAPPSGIYIPATALTAKGDLLTRDSSGYTALGVGETGQVLSADPDSQTGLSWVSPSTGEAGGTYEHTQASPATTWTINHGLGYRPNVAVEDSDGNSLDAVLQWPTINQVVVLLGSSTSGKAHLS